MDPVLNDDGPGEVTRIVYAWLPYGIILAAIVVAYLHIR
jgi:hypothetical protein